MTLNSRNSRKFRPAKFLRYTVFIQVHTPTSPCPTLSAHYLQGHNETERLMMPYGVIGQERVNDFSV